MTGNGSDTVHDIAIVGGGPAGLWAALKSALLFHSAIVLDKGPRTSRAFFVPNMDNLPGAPDGQSGRAFMKSIRDQVTHAEKVAGRSFVTFRDGVAITALTREDDGTFLLSGHEVQGRDREGPRVTARARVVVLATGVVDQQPYIGSEDYSIKAILPYANKGIADYCLLCDGHTIRGKSVAVLGLGRGSVGIAKTLKAHFGASDVAVVMCIPCATGDPADHDHPRHADLIGKAEADGLRVIDKTITRLEGLKEDRIRLHFDDASSAEFDRAWIAFGWYKVQNELAVALGAATDADGMVKTTEDCEAVDADGSPIPGLFVVGDLRSETWNQVPVAIGDAETAVITAFAEHL